MHHLICLLEKVNILLVNMFTFKSSQKSTLILFLLSLKNANVLA